MSSPLVIIATSGRALAQSAARTGRAIVVLDAFADRDTREVAEVHCVAADQGVALDEERLVAALAARSLDARLALVVGSGLERSPALVSRLAAYGRVYANDAGIVAALKDPELGGALLRACGWEVPPTQRAAPLDPRGWLQKETGGSGGAHIRRAQNATPGAEVYFQREVRGEAMSATLLADGERAYVLGYNRLRVEALGDAPYCYAGAVAGASLAPELRAAAQARLDRLVRVAGLRGLCGLDFVLAREGMTALEVNPRPTASFELYDDDVAEGLAHWHLASFERRVPDFAARIARAPGAVRALGIVYARHPVEIPAACEFPDWCRDLPPGGSAIPTGAPVLSVFAEAPGAAEAEREVEARSRAVRRMLARWASADLRAVA